MKSFSNEERLTMELMARVGVTGSNFRRTLTYLLSRLFSDFKIILLDLSDEFNCIARGNGMRYYDVAKHSINPVKSPRWEDVEKYVESLVEIIDYCFGTYNMKSIIAKALLDTLSASSETTIPEIASRLDFEAPEGGLSIYAPLEPFTFGTMRRVFGRREELDFEETLRTGIVFNLSGLATASSKAFATLTILNKLAHMEPELRTVIAVTYPSVVWPVGRRRDVAQVYVEHVLLEELERRGFLMVFAEKAFTGLSEGIVHSLDGIVFSPPSEALRPWNPWNLHTKLGRDLLEHPAAIMTRNCELKPLNIPANVPMRPLNGEEREKLRPSLRVYGELDGLRDILGEEYELGFRVIKMVRELGGRAAINSLVDEIRSKIGAGGLRAMATLLRHGYLKQVQEGGEQYLVLSGGGFE